jgi:hypothetical protein
MIWLAAMLLLMAPETIADLTEAVVQSGRVVDMAEAPSERLSAPLLLAPGAPPVLSFRYFDASDRGRFGNLGLMTDDAGH